MVLEVTVWKNSKQTLLLFKKVTVQKLVLGFWIFTSNHNVKYWPSGNSLVLIKNIVWDGFY